MKVQLQSVAGPSGIRVSDLIMPKNPDPIQVVLLASKLEAGAKLPPIKIAVEKTNHWTIDSKEFAGFGHLIKEGHQRREAYRLVFGETYEFLSDEIEVV